MRRIGGRRMFALAWLLAPLALLSPSAGDAHAQEWRGRLVSRLQYFEARPITRDSFPVELSVGTGRQRFVGDTTVTCAPGADYCYFYRPLQTRSTAPWVQDLDLNVWGLGLEGLRVHASLRTRTALGEEEFWPRSDDYFDLISAFAELERSRFRVRLGRDYQISGLGFHGYDGGSLTVFASPWRLELEVYGGWGLARGLPEPVTSDALASLEEFQPRNRNYLFGFRGSARPAAGLGFEGIYQREIETDRSGIASERVALEGTYSLARPVRIRAHADYDVAVGDWGKAGASVSWTPRRVLFLEGRVFRYKPVFSLQTIWAAFSPTPYSGWGVSAGVRPLAELSVRLHGERRGYGETDADVPFFRTTDRTWRAGASASWRAGQWDLEGGYWLNWGFGAALSAVDLGARFHPDPALGVGVRISAFQQIHEFRVGEGRVWSVGTDVRWAAPIGIIWGSLDRYRHDRRGDGVHGLDWTQMRGSLGLSVYLGSEPRDRQ